MSAGKHVICYLLSVKMGLIEFKVGWLGYQLLAVVLTSQFEVVYICILSALCFMTK